MRIIHLNGYTDKDRILFREFILYNIFDSMKKLVIAADKRGIVIEEEFRVKDSLFYFYQKYSDLNFL